MAIAEWHIQIRRGTGASPSPAKSPQDRPPLTIEEATSTWYELDLEKRDEVHVDSLCAWFEDQMDWVVPESERLVLFKALAGQGKGLKITKELWYANMVDYQTKGSKH